MIQSIENGRKEDGNRSIADKIIKRLHDLNKTIETNQGRWGWELLQNAIDSIADYEGRKISIQITLYSNKVEFKHNGVHFTEQDIRGLINQISSKEVEEGTMSKKIGRFGTGFLTTHLLSKIIQVQGIVETINKEFYKFKFSLDREGKTTAQLIPKIDKAWSEFHSSTQKINNSYNVDDFNTSFCYQLNTKEQESIAKIGVNEFIKLVPFVLTFIPKIEKVEVIDKISNKNIFFKKKKDINDDFIITILKNDNGVETDILLLTNSDDKVSIVTEVEKSEKGYSIKSIKDIPKIFCDFPLIGSENFHFPVIVNSFYFNPQTERDGVWLKKVNDTEVQENQQIFERAVKLYKDLLHKISEKPFYNLYNIVETRLPSIEEKYIDENWYKNFIQKPLKDFLPKEKLIELENNKTAKERISDIWFPLKSYSEKIQMKIWQFTYDLYPTAVCCKAHVTYWSNLSWEGWKVLDYSTLVFTISKQENIKNLSLTLKLDIKETFNWLNSFCQFLLEEEVNEQLFNKYKIIPNQNGVFIKKNELFIDEIEDEDLLNILEILGNDWKTILLNKKIEFGEYTPKTKKDIAIRITEKLNEKLKTSSSNNEDLIQTISLLSEWFENNKELGKELFAELYRKKAELFMNTISDKDSLYKVMRSKTDLIQLSKVAQAIDKDPQLLDSIKKIDEFNLLLKEFGANNVGELKRMLLLAQGITSSNSKSDITQEVLISLGVASIEELEEALKDKDLAQMFNHTSTPNANMFIYVQKLISRAKKNVIDHLMKLPNYDCSEIEELANTVLGGIKKDGLLIHIVVRPSDNGEVIVYYSSEKDTLDYENAELWIDNDKDEPRHLTLGKVLKIVGINKIPV